MSYFFLSVLQIYLIGAQSVQQSEAVNTENKTATYAINETAANEGKCWRRGDKNVGREGADKNGSNKML